MTETSPSLLIRLADPADNEGWERFIAIYRPMIRNWLVRHGVPASDCDDLVQDVLTVVVRRIGDFRHNQRVGAFRTWLRTIAVNCMRDFWKASKLKPLPAGSGEWAQMLDQLADPKNDSNQLWDLEHDRHVARRLLALIRPQFNDNTWLAFEATALKMEPPADVAGRLGITVNAVFVAKSKVLSRLRREAEGLIDA